MDSKVRFESVPDVMSKSGLHVDFIFLFLSSSLSYDKLRSCFLLRRQGSFGI